MTFRKLGLLGLTVVAGILAACEGETVVVDPGPDSPDVVLTVIPDTATLFVNGTRQLAAVVTGTTNQAVTWTSSSDATATVSATGLVTGRAVGAAVITAVSVADGRARDAATINVISVPSASIVITNVTQGGLVQPPTNLMGSIEVNAELNVPQGAQVQRIEFLLDNVIQANCTQTFQAGGSEELETDAAMVPIVCAINTAAFNAATGAATFPNGPHRVSAQVVSPAGTVVSSSQQDLTFNNTNIMRLTLAPQRTANGPTGLAWVGGTLGVTALPTLYSGGTLSSATFVVTGAAPVGASPRTATITQAVTAAGPVTVTFSPSSDTTFARIEDAGTTVT
ncbi:MAG: Ig-like domain-containing protein, partial [Longimicrobiales bacterium]